MTHSGGKAHEVGDRGQRFEVSFQHQANNPNIRSIFGWASNIKEANCMVDCINKHPSFCNPEIKDRKL